MLQLQNQLMAQMMMSMTPLAVLLVQVAVQQQMTRQRTMAQMKQLLMKTGSHCRLVTTMGLPSAALLSWLRGSRCGPRSRETPSTSCCRASFHQSRRRRQARLILIFFLWAR